ncbi:hypothetical protein KJK32_15580 [Streptomyces sp. JCM17656]|nr:hypothetical protein KJK32_15580 [Streptomyces sp. JCM17656]
MEQLPAVQLTLARQQFAPRGLVDEGPYDPGSRRLRRLPRPSATQPANQYPSAT